MQPNLYNLCGDILYVLYSMKPDAYWEYLEKTRVTEEPSEHDTTNHFVTK